MSRYLSERRFPHAPGRVFNVFFAQFDESAAETQTSHVARVDYLSDPPATAGSRYGIKTWGPFGMRKSGEMSIVDVDPGHSYRTEARSGGWQFDGLVEFLPDAKGTCVRLTMDATPCTFWAALFSPWMPVFMAVVLKSVLRKMASLDFSEPTAIASGHDEAPHATPAS
jgi:hypothetical protein